jgi:hypothetical protein
MTFDETYYEDIFKVTGIGNMESSLNLDISDKAYSDQLVIRISI